MKKSLKVIFLGKEMRDIYPHARWYQVAWYRILKSIRQLGIVSLGGLAVYGIYFVGLTQAQVTYVRGDTVEIVKGGQTLAELKAEMVDKIWSAESQKFEPAEGEVWMIYDPPKALRESGRCQQGGKKLAWECFSFGPMQWKIETLQGFYKEIHGQTISEMEAMAIANDLQKSQDLAFECWIKVEGCVWHWTTAEKNRQYFEIVIPIARKLSVEE